MMNFSLDPIEEKRYNQFLQDHDIRCGFGKNTVGGKISITFTPTGLGMIKVVRCKACGKEENITNFDNW